MRESTEESVRLAKFHGGALQHQAFWQGLALLRPEVRR